MRISRVFVLFIALLWINCSCTAGNGSFSEQFESGKKDAYAGREILLHTGKWFFDDALIGTSAPDKKNGAACARIRNEGSLTMAFDINESIRQVSIVHAGYGSDGPATWCAEYSDNSGTSWKTFSANITSRPVKQTVVLPLTHSGAIRFRIRKLGGGRLNIDDIQTSGTLTEPATETTGQTAAPQRGDNMTLGNPSGADKKQRNNYLLVKPQFALSYNNSKGIPNWVSWHLGTTWKGDEPRCNCFTPDKQLPEGFFKATPSGYISSGFDRGHLCPSDDRDGNREDNAATFLMCNIAPQAPNLNRDVWERLESYSRHLLADGNELYIIAGAYGTGGMGEKGKKNIIGGSINVPARFWKVIVVLPEGENDLGRVTAETRVIAVDMPNDQNANAYTWGHYRTSVDEIERATGYDLLSNVPVTIQAAIETRTDTGATR